MPRLMVIHQESQQLLTITSYHVNKQFLRKQKFTLTKKILISEVTKRIRKKGEPLSITGSVAS